MDMRLTPFQQGLVETARRLARERFAPRADARNLVERRLARGVGDARPMRSDGEAVGLVPQALQEMQHGMVRRQGEGRLLRREQALAPGIAVRPLGDRGQRHILDAELRKRLARRGKLPCPAIDQHEIGP